MQKRIIALIVILLFSGVVGAEETADKVGYGVELISYDENKIGFAVGQIKSLEGVTSDQAKNLLHNAPILLTDNLSEGDANILKSRLKAAGCKAEVKKFSETGYGVELLGYSRFGPATRKIMSFKGISWNKARSLLDNTPELLIDNLTKEEAKKMKEEFEAAGCKVEIRQFSEEPVERKTIKKKKTYKPRKIAKRATKKKPEPRSKKSQEKEESHAKRMQEYEEAKKSRKKVIASRLEGEEQIKFQEIKFFAKEATPTSTEGRKYSEEFPKSTTRYIYTEMSVINPLYGKDMGSNYGEKFLYKIKYLCYGPSGEYWGDFSPGEVLVNIKEDEVVRAEGQSGIGPRRTTGEWDVGTYKVEAWYGVKKLGESRFIIFDE